MATWKITVSGKGIRRDQIEKISQAVAAKYGEKVHIFVEDASLPESRAERFSAAMSLVSDAKGEVESLRDELQERLDNMPENLQSGDKASEIQDAIDNLDQAVQSLEEAEGVDVSFPGMY